MRSKGLLYKWLHTVGEIKKILEVRAMKDVQAGKKKAVAKIYFWSKLNGKHIAKS